MRAGLAIVLTAACGRVGFEARDDGGGAGSDGPGLDTAFCASASGHDEDGDAVDDACDVCPHLADGAQVDTDGDKVGDACDPEPTNPRQRIALFATMQAGDQPFGFESVGGGWTSLADSIAYDGTGYGGLLTDLTASNIVLSMGFTVTGYVNGPDVQHQIAIMPLDATSRFVEVGFNGTGTANVPDATIAYWDGATFASYLTMPTATGLHPGSMTIAGTYVVADSVVMDAGWPGEPYHVDFSTFLGYQGALQIRLDSNNVAYAVEWACVIAW